ncbi:platelet-activating factor acetylhydrolase isoform X2 [Amia ocellicauda]|uniref:platelet-activating factor acetylhydrolase isoform X2 n=1 Tax=Amia ocellicauda TaxID=2972642 RepID=UPI0034648205
MGNSWSNSLQIPRGKGPNEVGCTDLMMDHTVQGTFFRLYYPCETSAGYENPPWIPKKEYLYGLADFLKKNRSLIEKVFNYFYGSFTVPVAWNAPFKPSGKYPVIIFSHGLGAFRSLYSGICTEIASQGFIVAAVEHRDGSSSATYYYKDKSSTENSSSSVSNLEETWLYYRALQPTEPEFQLRNKQVQQRANECIKALNLLTDINTGSSVNNVLRLPFDWSKLKGSMDLCKTAVMGHSFGGATVIESLSKEPKFKCGIALDAWMFPLNDDVYPRVNQPILFINSEKFQWAGNIIRMKKLDSTTIQRKMITIRGSVHQSFPDFTFLTGPWIGKILKLKGEINPQIALDLSNKATLAFLQKHLKLENDFNQWDPLIDGQCDGRSLSVLHKM